MTNALLQQVKAAVEEGALKDQSVADKGFQRSIPPAGITTARFTGYVELGSQKQDDYQGQSKDDAPMVRLTWELNGPKYLRNIAKAGEPEKLIPHTITEEIKLSTDVRATFYKLVQRMKGDRDIKNLAELLGEGFIITIKHQSGKKDPTKKYAKMRTQVDGWMITPPIVPDPLTGDTTVVPVPEVSGDIRLLLQDAPSLDQWKSIFIDGTYTKKVAGTDVEVSKNFIQFKCLQSSSFEGSALEALLKDTGALDALKAEANLSAKVYQKETTSEDTKPEAAPTTAPTTAPEVAPTAATTTSEPVSEPDVQEETKAAPETPVDPLAALGLT